MATRRKRLPFGKIDEKKNGLFCASYMRTDGVRYSAPQPFQARAQAESFLINIRNKMSADDWEAPKSKQEQKLDSILFNDYAKQHLKERELRETSRGTYFDSFRNHIEPYF